MRFFCVQDGDLQSYVTFSFCRVSLHKQKRGEAMRHYGRRKRGGRRVELVWQKDGLFRYLEVIDAGGKKVAVIELDAETLNGLVKDYW